MTSFRFAGSTGALYGAYSEAPAASDAGHGVLVCNAFGQEAVRSQRMFRVLADRIARDCGQPTLRFDYYGTGDSDGDGAEGSIEQWAHDTLAADAELRSRSGCREVSWIGLRLGATIAAIASSRIALPPRNLLLWEPVINGSAWLDELRRGHNEELAKAYSWVKGAHGAGQANVSSDPLTESVGFPLPEVLLSELAALTPSVFDDATCKRLIYLTGRPIELVAPARKSGPIPGRPDTTWLQVSETDWNSDEAMNSAIVPADVIRAVVEELRGA